MSLLDYESRFAKLNPNKANGKTSPHKIAMLLVVMDLIASGEIEHNEIIYSDSLRLSFTQHFNRIKNETDRDSPFLPFFHLRREGFWHHAIKPGRKARYDQLTTASGPGAIESNINHAYFDDELFELLCSKVVRDLLQAALHQNLVLTQEHRVKLLTVGNGWNWLECEFCVKDYFDMLFKQFKGEKLNKAEHNRNLQPKLNKRSKNSIEFKHQNISAILVEMRMPYITGYRPAYNYQAQLKQVVLAYLAATPIVQDRFIEEADSSDFVQANIDWEKVLDTDIPEQVSSVKEPKRAYLARKTNYAEREANNRTLGERGEQFVIDFERYRLEKAGRPDLAKEVEWSSKEHGDGLGYDVRSFPVFNGIARDEERFIEVKTTNSGKDHPFFITENELARSREFEKQYSLYRVYNFKHKARIFELEGMVEQHVQLRARSYEASFRFNNITS